VEIAVDTVAQLSPAPLPGVRADLKAAWRVARLFLRLQKSHPLWLRCQTRANRALAVEWFALIGVTYVLVFAPLPWALKIVLLVPWSLYSSLAIDVAIHYFNHWPLFRREGWNAFARALGVLVFVNPMEIRYHHWQHHRYNDPFDDPQTALREIATREGFRGWLALAGYLARETARSLKGILPWTAQEPYIRSLARTRPAHYREIVAVRWAIFGWLLVVLAVRPTQGALLATATLLLAPLASFVMNLTDHAPSDLAHPFRQATYLEPGSRRERFLSVVNHYTAATHLTHHLFPQVHWCHIRRLQRRMLRLYASYGAPRSLVVNSTLLGNPVGLLRVLAALKRRETLAGWSS